MMVSTIIDDRLINAAAVRDFFGGVSDMWIHRRLRDDGAFPPPFRIQGRRFWRLDELRAYRDAQREAPWPPAP